jgi:hypothetical protein
VIPQKNFCPFFEKHMFVVVKNGLLRPLERSQFVDNISG